MEAMHPAAGPETMAPLASLSLTHVYYNPDDPISLLCAYLALVPQALCIIYATLLWTSREAEVLLMFAGQMGCEAVNFLLKRLIKEERPARISNTNSKGYGMPSSHAQFVAFWAVALALFLVGRHRPASTTTTTMTNGASRSTSSATKEGRKASILQDMAALEAYARQPWSMLERLILSVAAMTLAGAVAWSRIYLEYHTPKQVLVGCGAGATCALAWFGVTAVARNMGLLAWVIDTPVARALRVRDLVVAEDLSQAGWEKWQTMRAREVGVKAR